MRPLEGFHVLALALNLPGPTAVARLCELGATAVKIEPSAGDPLAHAHPRWYEELHRGLTLLTLDLKGADGRKQLDRWLARSDLLMTAMRPAALQRLGLDWPSLHARFPRLCHVAIVGHAATHDDRPGHDLTFQARAGLLEPPGLPRACLADTAGSQRAVAASLALLLARERCGESDCDEVSLAAAAEECAAPWRYGLTAPDGLLSGASPRYGLYRAREGWVALAALEDHFWETLTRELDLTAADRAALERAFLTRTAEEWEAWAEERGLPLARVR